MERTHGRDVTDQLSARDSAKIFEAAPDAILVIDEKGNILAANPQAGRLFGCEAEQLVGRGVDSLVPTRHRVAHAAHRERYAEEPRSRPMGIGLELTALHSDGWEIPVEISLSPLPSPQGLRVICTVRDVTERVRYREFGRAALRAAEEERKRLALDTAAALHRIARGLRPPALAEAGLEAAIRADVRSRLADTDIDVGIDLDSVGELLDEDQKLVLYRILQEAISNVVRHAYASRLSIVVRRDGDHVVADITDDGRGFVVDEVDVLAGRLGILGMRERAASVGAKLSITSELGEGTHLAVELPLRPAPGEGDASGSAGKDEPSEETVDA